MTRLSYRLYRFASALAYHLPRRLTKGGLLVFGGMILAGAIGSDLDQSVASEAFALLLSLLAVSVLWAPFFRGEFSAQRALPRLASVGQPFRYRVQIRNGAARAFRGLEYLEDLADPRPSLADFAELMRPAEQLRAFRLARLPRRRLDFRQAVIKPTPLPDLGGQGVADAQLEVLPLRRGPLRFRSATVAQPDPLGLIRSFVRVRLPQTVLVLPKRYPLPRPAFPGTRNYQPGGVALASSIGESEDFVSLRDYRPGDPFRRIHWRSWARAGRPIVKQYQDEFFVRHALVLDTFTWPSRSDVFEEAVSVAASFACTMDTQESLLDLLFVGSRAFCFTMGRGLGEAEQALEILASVRLAPEKQFRNLRDLVLRHARLDSGCVCVFVAWDEARQELVRSLRQLGLATLVLVVTEPGSAPALRRCITGADLGDVHVLETGRIAEGLQTL